MDMRPLGRSGLEIAPVVLGGNVFGWTIDEKQSFELLNRFVDAGFNAVDTADAYSAWVPGNRGGESETVIGRWFQMQPTRRDDVVLITKVGSEMGPGRKGLSAAWITQAVEDSLRRLQTDHIDLYLSHFPDPNTPFEETLRAYEGLIQSGKVLAIGASNLDAAQLRESLEVAKALKLPRYEVLQPGYSLVERRAFEGELAELCESEEMGVITYFSLASGFLSGKYRSEADLAGRARGAMVSKYLNPRGLRVLAALDEVAARHGAEPSEVALAWLMAQPGVTAPIASATTSEQLQSLLRSAVLELSEEDLAQLGEASA